MLVDEVFVRGFLCMDVRGMIENVKLRDFLKGMRTGKHLTQHSSMGDAPFDEGNATVHQGRKFSSNLVR